MAYRGGPYGSGSLKPRKVKVRKRAKDPVSRAVSTVVRSTTRAATPPSRSTGRPPQQVVRQRATRQAGRPARVKIKRRQQKAAERRRVALAVLNRTARSVETTAWLTDPKRVVADTAAASIARTARKTSQAQHPARRTLYTPLTAQGRKAAAIKVGTTKPRGQGRVVTSSHPKYHPLPKPKVISHKAVLKAKKSERQKDPDLFRTHPDEALAYHKAPTFKKSPVGKAERNIRKYLKHKVDTGPQLGAAFTPATLTDPGAKVVKNFVKDAIDTPTNVAASTFVTGHALAKAAGGDTEEIKKVGKSLKDDTFVGNVLQGKFKKAGEVAEKHPLNSLLELSGAKAVVGRTAGFGLRHAPSKKLRKAGSTKRKPLRLYGHVEGGPTMKRTYSRDAINKALQKTHEAAQRSVGRDPDVAHGRRQKHELHLRGNDEIALTEGLRRHGRGKAVTETHRATHAPRIKIRKKGRTPGLKKHHEDAIALVVERAIRRPDTVKSDLVRYREKLEEIDPKTLYPDGQEMRAKLIKQVDGLLKNKEFLADPHPAFKAAETVIKAEAERTTALKATKMLSDDEEAAKYVPYSVLHMGAKPSKTGGPPTIQDVPIPVPIIKAHMEANGVAEPGFFSQRPGATGKSSFYTAIAGKNMRRPANYSKTRGGGATAEGTYDATPDALAAQGSHSANMSEAAQGFDRYVSEFGIKRPIEKGEKDTAGYWKSHDEASHAAAELQEKVGVELTPMNVGRTNEIKNLLNAGEPSASALTNLSARVHQAFEPDNQAGEYVLVPKILADKLKSSVAPRAKWEQAAQEYSRIFKATVLSGSTKWLFGNVTDLTLRSLMEGITPVDLVRGKQVLKGLEKVDPRAAEVLRERLGTNFIGSQAGMETFRERGRIASTLPARAVAEPWKLQKRAVYGANSAMERNANFAALGKYARQNTKRSAKDIGGFFKVGQKGLEQAIDGLRGTTEQVAAARFVERVYGRWGKMSPEAKRFLIHAPFVQWLNVATKYVFVTLPLHHPIKTGIIAALSDATEEERKALGFHIDPFSVAQALEGYLQGGVPSGDKVIPFGRYTSFGILADAPDSLVDFLLPQFQSAMNVAGGEDFLGREIKNDDGTSLSRSQKLGLAVYTLLEGSVPWLSYSRRLQEGGGSSKPTSTVFNPKVFNPGEGTGDAFDKVFNPLRPQTARYSNEEKKGRTSVPKLRAPGDFSAPAPSGQKPGSFNPPSTPGVPTPGALKGATAKFPTELSAWMGTGAVNKAARLATQDLKPLKQLKPGKPIRKVRVQAHPQRANNTAATPQSEVLGGLEAVASALGQKGPKRREQIPTKGQKTIKVEATGEKVPSGVPAEYRRYLAKYGHLADEEAAKWGLTGAELIAKIHKVESGFEHRLPDGSLKTSSAGAKGAGQFMPGTRDGFIQRYGVDPWKNTESAVKATALYMRDSGLAAYNPLNGGRNTAYEQAVVNADVGKGTAKVKRGKGPVGKVVGKPLDRPGVKTHKSIIDFAKHVAGVAGTPIQIGTGSNHSRLTASGNVSDHWSGHALDLPAAGGKLTHMGQSALVAAGMKPAQAKKELGGIYNINGYQIIFNAADHYDHLHVGESGSHQDVGGSYSLAGSAPSFPAMSSGTGTSGGVSTGAVGGSSRTKAGKRRAKVKKKPEADISALLELLARSPSVGSSDPLAQQKRAASDSASLLRAVAAMKK